MSGLDFKHSKPDPEIYFYTMEKMGVKPEDCYKSLVDACLKNIYQPLINSNYTIACPTLVDLWEELQRQLKPGECDCYETKRNGGPRPTVKWLCSFT